MTISSFTRTISVSALLPIIFFVASPAQDFKSSSSFASQKQAKALLDEGIAALGGLGSIETVAWDTAGTNFGLGQSPSFAMKTSPSLQNKESAQVDFRKNRLTREVMFQTPGFIWHPRYVIENGKGYYINLFSATYGDYDASLSGHRAAFRAVPQLFLKEVLDRAETLRSAVTVTLNGRKYESLTFLDGDQQVVTLYFDAKSKLLYKNETVFQDSLFGDSVAEGTFEDYHRAGGFQIPMRRIQRQNGVVVAQLEYSRMVFNQPLSEEFFHIPNQFEKAETVQWPRQLTAEPLGKDVYLIRTPNYNVMAVGFDDFTLMVEAPENDRYSGLSEHVLKKVDELLPGKPVKHVTFTHYHYDHGGGIREYIAKETNIITSPGNVEFLRHIAQVPYTLKPDLQSREASSRRSLCYRIRSTFCPTRRARLKSMILVRGAIPRKN